MPGRPEAEMVRMVQGGSNRERHDGMSRTAGERRPARQPQEKRLGLGGRVHDDDHDPAVPVQKRGGEQIVGGGKADHILEMVARAPMKSHPSGRTGRLRDRPEPPRPADTSCFGGCDPKSGFSYLPIRFLP